MGRCHEFGLQISEGCNHEMLAGDNECTCAGCGVACGGQFAGCPDVWARGQLAMAHTEVAFGTRTATLERVDTPAAVNGPTATNGVAASWPPEPPLPPVDPLVTPVAVPVPPEAAFEPGAAPPAPEHEESPADAGTPPLPQTVTDVSGELRTVTEGLKLQQSMLGELLTGLTRQQAMMAELLDARHAELRLAMVAESLPDAVADAVARSWAANQEQLTEAAVALAKSIGLESAVTKALRQVEGRADNRFEEFCDRQEKLVAKAVRAGARQAEAKPAATAPAKTAAKRAQPAKKTSRTSSQGSRPSRRSLGS